MISSEILNITKSRNNTDEYEIKFELLNNQTIKTINAKAQVTASQCFTPRNYGINVDGRKLGIKITSPIKSY